MKRSFFKGERLHPAGIIAHPAHCILPVSALWLLTSGFSPAILDTNNNGLSDFWEREFNAGELFPANFDPQTDEDKDSWNNMEEAAAGTDPNDANPPDGIIRPATEHVPAVIGEQNGVPVVVSSESIKVRWPTLTGKQYTLLYSPDLTQGSWLPIGYPFIANGGVNEYVFYEINATDKCFWRVAVTDVDSDGDSLTNHEESIFGTNPDYAQTFTGIPDAWLASYYNTVIEFDPQEDDDDDGLTNFEEYLYGTNPLNSDTDGDSVSDYAEVNQGSNPDNASGGGSPPPDPVIDVSFLVGGDFASWRMEILPKGPRDNRAALKLASPNPGATETKTYKLWKNNRYEITLHRTGGYEDWYCWEAMVDDRPDAFTFDDGWGWITDGVRNDQGHFFTVAGHWLADNSQGLLSAHQHSYAMDIASPLKAELVPVAIEDNIEATGVDIVSNSVNPDVAGYQDKLWIMAPSGNDLDNNPCSNSMKFRIPVNPSSDLEISYPQGQQAPATPTPGTVTLGAAAADCSWHGESATTTETPAVAWKIGASGETKTEVDLPIAVKTMKRRTVKVALHQIVSVVPGKPNNPPDHMPTNLQVEEKLNQIFGRQINAWFQVTPLPVEEVPFDIADEDTYLPKEFQPGVQPTPGDGYMVMHLWGQPEVSIATASRPADYDIHVYVLGGASPIQTLVASQYNPDHLVPGENLLGRANTAPGANYCIIDGDRTSNVFPDRHRTPEDVLHTIAHEVGHVIVGQGHPDDEEGDAPLSGTDRTTRLMCSGPRWNANSLLLVKREWDKAEEWLSSRPNGDN